MKIAFNLIGRLFSRNFSIYEESGQLYLKKSGASTQLTELALFNDFIEFEKGLLGLTLKLHIDNQTKYFKFLKNDSSTLKSISTLNSLISSSLERQISQFYSEFSHLAFEQYIRDSWVLDLNRKLLFFKDKYTNSVTPWEEHLDPKILASLHLLLDLYPIENNLAELRQKFEQKSLKERKKFFDTVESNPLTGEQRLAVIRDNDRNLVLAAAGTGKTSVMVAKKLNLIDTGRATPSEILVLAFNKKAAEELVERFKLRAENTGVEIDNETEILTFHALGRKILQKSGITTSISRFSEDPMSLKLWVSKWLTEYVQSSSRKMQQFIQLSYHPQNPFEFESKRDYENYVRDNEFRTLQGERVKGFQELIIANWFFLNGIEYQYEPTYLSKRRVEIGFDYRPDFHITGTNIYLEHFGIDRQGNTRPGIDKHKYNDAIKSKRLLHKEFGTILLETYHYDWVEDNLENHLQQLITEHEIPVNPIPPEEILEHLKESGFLQDSAEMYLKSLQAVRTERLDKPSILERLKTSHVFNYKLYTTFLTDLNNAYVAELEKQDAIDFDDMILRATQAVKNHDFYPPWKYILVDEFQDISSARMEFLQSLIKHGKNIGLTVVGDDWQSIYRFSGGKLELTTQFEKLVGSHSKTILQKTFRYNNNIAEVAGRFVMTNPEQYKKNVITHHHVDKPEVHLLDDYINGENDLAKKTVHVINTIREREPKASIAVLARYNYLLKEAKTLNQLQDVNFWTFHRSKGLEADYCILIGFFQGKVGFPNENRGDEVVEALLPSLDDFKHSEERRLLYVGITRARKKSYIIADPNSPSSFVLEMINNDYPINISSGRFQEKYRKTFKCPVCEDGYFRLQQGQFGKFYSCSSGTACSSKPRICSECGAPSVDGETCSTCQNYECGHEMKICRVCGRPMKIRTGKFGRFWGCTGFGIKDDQCKYTEKI